MSKKIKYYQYSLEGELIGTYETLKEASASADMGLTTLHDYLSGKVSNPTSNFIWTKGPIDENENVGPKILFFDLESTPMIGYHFGLFKQNISLDQVIEKPHLICWAAKWADSDEIFGDVNTPEEMVAHDDGRISKSLWKVMNEADIVVAHYGNGFDVPLANTRFLINGLPPLTPNKSVDTKQISSKYFKMYSNKLDALAELFGIQGKFHTSFSLWRGCMEGKQSSLDEMFEYNLQDVNVLEQVYYKLLPYAKNHPNVAVYNKESKIPVCSRCGGSHLTYTDKNHITSVSSFRTLRCNDCGSISRERKSVLNIDKRKTMLTASI